MIVSFALALIAGFAVPYAEPLVKSGVAAVFPEDARLNATELTLVTLLGLLALSALITAFFGLNTVSFATVLGGGFGFFGRRIYAFVRDPDGTDVADEARWDGEVRPAGQGASEEARTEDPDEVALRAVDEAMRASSAAQQKKDP